MKLRACGNSALPLLLLPFLVPSLAASLESDLGKNARLRITPRHDVPVDGKDGKPHLGPFVEKKTDSNYHDLPPLQGRPRDVTVVDGEKIPESNDGVMSDKNRERPQKGTTGTEGGVSQKDRDRKAREGKTGQRAVGQPQSPKEQPPLPHSEEQKLQTSDDKYKKEKTIKEDDDSSYMRLGKPANLPDVSREGADSLPKIGLDMEKPMTGSPRKAGQTGRDDDEDDVLYEGEDDGIIRPLHSFVLSLTMILVSEVGDKTFLVAALMAMKHDRFLVFSAAYGALLVMTVLSALLGHAVPTLIPKRLTSLLAAGLFLVFGLKLLREGLKMDPDEGVSAEMEEVEQELADKEKEHHGPGYGRHSSSSPRALEMGLGSKPGRGSRSKGRFPSPPRSPSQSPPRRPSSPRGGRSLHDFVHGVGNLCSLLLSPAWVQTFAMTFVGEWGDRSQIATIAMAAGQDYWWVTLGAMCGHAVCTGVAVVGGRAIAGRVSLKVVTVGGAVAFLVFAFVYLIEALHG
ncbi:hypothetical protein CP532_6161 [Ophiocordyceps camponoti-leonardi (nom. inval.)]|nr:hypothetical protein CP532_6161 [Ophiocordyceps camponoti-leonardi (nom. inval.)]